MDTPALGPLDGAALTHGFQIAFYVLAALAALAAVVSAIMIEPGAAATTSVEDSAAEPDARARRGRLIGLLLPFAVFEGEAVSAAASPSCAAFSS